MPHLDSSAASLVALPAFDAAHWRQRSDERRARLAAAGAATKLRPAVPPHAGWRAPRPDPDVLHWWADGTVTYRLPHWAPTRRQMLTARRVLLVVASHYGFRADDLRAARRDSPVVRARQMAYWALRTACGISNSEIGRVLGGRDPTSALHGVRRVEARIARGDAETLAAIAAIRAALGLGGGP